MNEQNAKLPQEQKASRSALTPEARPSTQLSSGDSIKQVGEVPVLSLEVYNLALFEVLTEESKNLAKYFTEESKLVEVSNYPAFLLPCHKLLLENWRKTTNKSVTPGAKVTFSPLPEPHKFSSMSVQQAEQVRALIRACDPKVKIMAVQGGNHRTYCYNLETGKIKSSPIPRANFADEGESDALYNIGTCILTTAASCLAECIKAKLQLKLTEQKLSITYSVLSYLYQHNKVQIAGSSITLKDITAAQLAQEFLCKHAWENIYAEQVRAIIASKKLRTTDAGACLTLDRDRADIKEYDKMLLEDPNRGSWELWEPQGKAGLEIVPTTKLYYARDPRMDIVEGGIVGIDFGTKSTVVVAQNSDSSITPLRVGMGRYERVAKSQDYENPTVMQLRDIQSFWEIYSRGEGRPLTKWEDITTSHTAAENWKNNTDSAQHFSFFGELKQWAGSDKKRVRIRDIKGRELSLPPYAKLPEEALDPIELYAYYIGLYINNQHTGKIYMEYILSFPVTYARDIRERILASFRRGLRRSLPQSILQDEQCMENFSVEVGAGEPAAYAVCALQAYHFAPCAGEEIVYGVFDFGGGTTDFDFGVWRRASGPKERRFKYVIEHFGNEGDKYLGGENLLELLAYEVFKKNQAKMREKELSFSLPVEGKSFMGSELLISDSQEARTNTKHLVEALRPLWEEKEVAEGEIEEECEDEDPFAAGVIKDLQLFTRSGERCSDVELKVDEKELRALLKERIKRGVTEFFDALLGLYKDGKHIDKLKNTQQIHILLAGNSSKSPILKQCFAEGKQEFMAKLQMESSKIDPETEFITIYPPLGTKEADKLLQDMQVAASEYQNPERPTGKTGVAIGLVQCRLGSKIKVVAEKKSSEEIRFGFYVGEEDEDGYFATLLTRDTPYGQWVEYYDAGVKDFEFYYTTSPSAELERGLKVTEAKRSRQHLPRIAINEDWLIYLRSVAPKVVEFVVAESQEAVEAGQYKCDIVQVYLEE